MKASPKENSSWHLAWHLSKCSLYVCINKHGSTEFVSCEGLRPRALESEMPGLETELHFL